MSYLLCKVTVVKRYTDEASARAALAKTNEHENHVLVKEAPCQQPMSMEKSSLSVTRAGKSSKQVNRTGKKRANNSTKKVGRRVK